VPPPAAAGRAAATLVANLDASDYVGRIAIGRIFNGRVKIGDAVAVVKHDTAVQHQGDQAMRVRRPQASTSGSRGGRHCLPGRHRESIGETITDMEHQIAIRRSRSTTDGAHDLWRQHLAGGRP
jgi:GTP-binding protein